jgi:hypothetical protein
MLSLQECPVLDQGLPNERLEAAPQALHPEKLNA